MTKIAIIGGGAAGLMAAARIAELSGERGGKACEVFLIERNKVLGKKVIMSGGGRCNLTTGLEDLKEILKRYPRGGNFLRTAMYEFPPSAMMEWTSGQGVPLKVEEDMRVFPKSNNGAHVVRAFEKVLAKFGVNVLFETAVKTIVKDGAEFVLGFESGAGGEIREDMRMDKVILCPGGQAHRKTGSQGDGYGFAEALGHKVTPLAPSLNAFLLAETWARDLAGLSFSEVALTFRGEKKFMFSGPMMFTHKGVTGPAVFALSANAAYEVFDKGRPAQLFCDFFPEQNHEQLQDLFDEEFSVHFRKSFQNILCHFVPKTFAESLCEQLSVDGAKRPNELSKKDLNRVMNALKNLSLTIVGRVAGDEFVTAGGIELSEVDSRTMESKLCKGLYFAGEILDYDGFTGGFNLQAAWATGRAAGESAVC